MPSTIPEIDEAEFDRVLTTSKIPVLVEFTAAWCGPCRALAPTLEAIAAEQAGRVLVRAVDADRCPNLSSRFGVRGLPTTIAFDSGHERARHLGATNKKRLLSLAGLDGASVTSASPRRA